MSENINNENILINTYETISNLSVIVNSDIILNEENTYNNELITDIVSPINEPNKKIKKSINKRSRSIIKLGINNLNNDIHTDLEKRTENDEMKNDNFPSKSKRKQKSERTSISLDI